MVKSYKHTLASNQGKNEYIETVLYKEWKRVAGILMKLHMNYYYRYNKLCDTTELYRSIDSFMTERYKDCINRQVVGMLKSKISNFKNEFVRIVMSSSLNEREKIDLCLVNKRNLFFAKEDDKGVKYKVPPESIKLARWIFKNFFGKLPSCKNINMVLQSKIVTIETPDNSNNKFKYMLKLSAGDKNKRGQYLYLPVNNNKYADKNNGELSTSCTLNLKGNKLKNVTFTKETPDKDRQKPVLNDVKISFDIGLNKLIALDNGECYGMKYMRTLKKLDDKLISIQKKLQKEHGDHVNLSKFKEYTDLVDYIRAYSKNEINRIMNKIYTKHKPSVIVVEDLDFKGSRLNHKTNRLLHKFGLGLITKKLSQLNVDYGVDIKYVDAAYTSQVCDGCGYVDSGNRKSQERFVCQSCGRKINADVNGSRTVKRFAERFGDELFLGSKGRSKKRTLLVDDFISSKVWVNDKRIIQVLLGNKYFADYHATLRERYDELTVTS